MLCPSSLFLDAPYTPLPPSYHSLYPFSTPLRFFANPAKLQFKKENLELPTFSRVEFGSVEQKNGIRMHNIYPGSPPTLGNPRPSSLTNLGWISLPFSRRLELFCENFLNTRKSVEIGNRRFLLKTSAKLTSFTFQFPDGKLFAKFKNFRDHFYRSNK